MESLYIQGFSEHVHTNVTTDTATRFTHMIDILPIFTFEGRDSTLFTFSCNYSIYKTYPDLSLALPETRIILRGSKMSI